MVSAGEGRMTHLDISEHEGMVPASGSGSGWRQGLGLGLSRGDQLRVDQPCWQRSRKGHGGA